MLSINRSILLILAIQLAIFWSNQLYSQIDNHEQDSVMTEIKPLPKKVKYGFSICLNNDFINANHDPSQEIYIKNRNAIRLGIFAELFSNKSLSLRIMTDIIHRRSYINVGYVGANPISQYRINPFSIDFMSHLKYNLPIGPSRIYGALGLSVNVPIREEMQTPNDYRVRGGYNADFGIGFELPLKQFDLSPELRYSYGLNNINMHPGLLDLHINSLVLALIFRG